jgi:signal transduction histidine kinase
MTEVLPTIASRFGLCERLAGRMAVARAWRHDRPPGRINLHALLALLVVSFLVVPVLLFAQFHAERRGDEVLLLKAMRDQLMTIGTALSVEIRESGLSSYAVLDDRLKLLTPPDMRVKILYRPNSGELSNAFLYVATSTEIDAARLEEERTGLMRAGVLAALDESCSVDGDSMFRFGAETGGEELVIGVVPIRAPQGCWAVVASYASGGFLETAVARPVWQLPRVQIAFAVYAAMALVVVAVLLRIHGTVTALRETASAISSNPDEPVRFSAVSDVSELDSTARSLDRMVEELRKARLEAIHASESKTRYLTNISHELRTPLNAIIGFSQVIEKELFGPIGEPRYLEYAADIESSGRYLLDMINDVLDLARLEAGRFELSIETMDPNVQIAWTVRLLAGEARKHGHRLDVRVPETLPPLRADIRAFRSILVNLVSNAIKYTPEGGLIDLCGTVTGSGEIAVTVADNGAGIAPEDLDRAFEPYGRGSDALTVQREGTGLGLPLVRHLVELHGGRLTLDSVVGRGTTVSVFLPADTGAVEPYAG